MGFKKQQGSLLLMTLVYLLLLSILVAVTHEHSILSERLSRNFWQQMQLATVTDNYLIAMEKSLHHQPIECSVEMQLANHYFSLDNGYWDQLSACRTTLDGIRFSAVIEKIASQRDQDFYRVTVHAKASQGTLVQQSIYVIGNNAYHDVLIGRQTWRQR